MAEDFWAPVFARLQEDHEFLQLVLQDTSDSDLIAWIKPNPALVMRCARFLQKNKITSRSAIIAELWKYAQTSLPLRKMILFTWIEKNPLTMSFPTMAFNEDNQKKLTAGEFGSPEKIRILAAIDPRPGTRTFYLSYLADRPSPEKNTALPEKPAKNEVPANIHDSCELRIKELETALANVKTDCRQQKKLLEAKITEIAGQSRKIEDQNKLLNSCQESEKQLRHEKLTLQLKLQNLEAALAQAAQPQATKPAVDNQDTLIDNLKEQISGLQKALSNRDASIARLEAEKATMKKSISSEEEKDQRIASLQKKLSENITEKVSHLAGQLVTRTRNHEGKGCWLFLSLTGENILINDSMVKKARLCLEELCLLTLDHVKMPLQIESLELGSRQELVGFIEHENGLFYLQTDAERFPVRVDTDENLHKQPVRAIWLPEWLERSAGIYSAEPLKTGATEIHPLQEASIKQIKDFFKIETLNYSLFCQALEKLEIKFKDSQEQTIAFTEDYRKILNSVRMSMAATLFCQTHECRELAKNAMLARACKSGESCSFCGKFHNDEPMMPQLQFSGQKILIFGGDRVGHEYEKVLEQHNLQAQWHSGFRNMNELKSGLGDPDLVVIITRQISHTLLRELTSYCEKNRTRILFCNRRGTSGLLEELREFLK